MGMCGRGGRNRAVSEPKNWNSQREGQEGRAFCGVAISGCPTWESVVGKLGECLLAESPTCAQLGPTCMSKPASPDVYILVPRDRQTLNGPHTRHHALWKITPIISPWRGIIERVVVPKMQNCPKGLFG